VFRDPCSTFARCLGLASTAWLLACVVHEDLGPPGKNMTGPVTGATTSSVDSDGSGDESEAGAESETGALGDTLGCDPLADPESECGPGMACDLTSGACVPASGSGLENDPCTAQDECSPGLVCFDGRCRELCDAQGGQGCQADQVCAAAADPLPGLCLAGCQLTFGECAFEGEACKRVLGSGGQTYAACIDNPGQGLSGDECSADTDCALAHLCTASAEHTLPCTNDAASCCTPICDSFELPCVGTEPICYVLNIPGQENAGYCGIEQ
jgi:hypothetical protein